MSKDKHKKAARNSQSKEREAVAWADRLRAELAEAHGEIAQLRERLAAVSQAAQAGEDGAS